MDVLVAWMASMASTVRSYPIGMMMGKIVMVYQVDSSGMAKMLEKSRRGFRLQLLFFTHIFVLCHYVAVVMSSGKASEWQESCHV